MSAERKPRRALILFYAEDEQITGQSIRTRLVRRTYRIIDRPAVMGTHADDRRLLGIVSMPEPDPSPSKPVAPPCEHTTEGEPR